MQHSKWLRNKLINNTEICPCYSTACDTNSNSHSYGNWMYTDNEQCL